LQHLATDYLDYIGLAKLDTYIKIKKMVWTCNV
jgi:hypothetical protein